MNEQSRTVNTKIAGRQEESNKAAINHNKIARLHILNRSNNFRNSTQELAKKCCAPVNAGKRAYEIKAKHLINMVYEEKK